MATYSLKPGYAFHCAEQGFDFLDIPNDWWEIEVVSDDACERAGFVGLLNIDGAACAAFVDDFDGTHYAQTVVCARDR